MIFFSCTTIKIILNGIISSDFAAAHCTLWQMWPKYVKWISVWFISFIILDSFLHPGRGVMLYTIYCHSSEKKRFAFNFLLQRNASKFAIIIEKENPHSFFFISSNFEIYLINALVYVDKKLLGFSFFITIANFEAFL